MALAASKLPIAKRPYQARGAALRLWTCRDEEILIEGPAGTGKTRAILEKIHFCLMKYAGARALIVRQTRESMTESVLVTYEEKVVPEGSAIVEGPQRNLRQHYSYPNGSELVVGGLDKSIKIMSTEYDIIAVFESLEVIEQAFEDLTTRLRNGVMPYQQIICDCNPGAPSHWLNKRPKTGKMTRLKSRHIDNPVFFNRVESRWHGLRQTVFVPTKAGQKYLNKLKRLSGPKRKRLYEGKWAAFEGMVYEDYDEEIHLIPRFEIPATWPRLRSVDFGFSNPFVCQWWCLDSDRRMFRYRELYHTRRIVSDHATQIKAYSGDERYIANISDHDSEDRATLHDAGIMTTPAFKAIEPGIDAVSKRLRDPGDGKRRIYLMRDSLIERDEQLIDDNLPWCTEAEIEGYVRPPLKPDSDKNVKEDPMDKNNHGMDAMRYAVCYVDDVSGEMINVTGDVATVVANDGSFGSPPEKATR